MTGFLRDKRFLAELHRLLWIEPFENCGTFDPGWSCREHALLVACVIRANGESVRIAHGKNMFVQGADGPCRPMGFGQKRDAGSGHTWLKSNSDKVIDLSPRLAAAGVTGWRSVECSGIVKGEWLPTGHSNVVTCDSGEEYDEAIALASRHDGVNTAIYWEQTEECLTASLLGKALELVNSPLTDELRKFRDVEIYSKAALHLIEIAAGSGRPLAGVAQRKAWKFIAALSNDATDRLIARTGLNTRSEDPASRENRSV
jgi:hypothetical protein